MLRLFGRKIFFLYFSVFGATENDGDRTQIIFNLTVKASFSEFKLFILARTFVGIRHQRKLKFVGSPNLSPKVPDCRNSVTLVRFQGWWPESGNL